mmetsp:Transcript_17202/g.60446  ORF Transcript_17202/g.60446 Transcript_17202/m.60446 type:complete len:208 (+) Transcript_17202:1316-1939(+)
MLLARLVLRDSNASLASLLRRLEATLIVRPRTAPPLLVDTGTTDPSAATMHNAPAAAPCGTATPACPAMTYFVGAPSAASDTGTGLPSAPATKYCAPGGTKGTCTTSVADAWWLRTDAGPLGAGPVDRGVPSDATTGSGKPPALIITSAPGDEPAGTGTPLTPATAYSGALPAAASTGTGLPSAPITNCGSAAAPLTATGTPAAPTT